ncbi:MAG: class I SAM-dependent methyltransferase [Patescibacteria group bacterium]|nr:class I SAM-dependent methyltransferase [Patescibacteria group bacterium]
MLKEIHPKRRILDMGCGEKKLAHKKRFPNYNFMGEVVGLDLNKTEQTDVVCDLNKGKIPFKDNYFDIVYTHHCLEHLENPVEVLLDVHRILKKGGYFLIRVPHVSYIGSMADLTHIRLFGYSSLNFLTQGDHAQLKNKERFKLIKRKIIFGRFYRSLGIEYFANHFPNIYNCFFEGIFTAREMHFELKKCL